MSIERLQPGPIQLRGIEKDKQIDKASLPQSSVVNGRNFEFFKPPLEVRNILKSDNKNLENLKEKISSWDKVKSYIKIAVIVIAVAAAAIGVIAGLSFLSVWTGGLPVILTAAALTAKFATAGGVAVLAAKIGALYLSTAGLTAYIGLKADPGRSAQKDLQQAQNWTTLYNKLPVKEKEAFQKTLFSQFKKNCSKNFDNPSEQTKIAYANTLTKNVLNSPTGEKLYKEYALATSKNNPKAAKRFKEIAQEEIPFELRDNTFQAVQKKLNQDFLKKIQNELDHLEINSQNSILTIEREKKSQQGEVLGDHSTHIKNTLLKSELLKTYLEDQNTLRIPDALFIPSGKSQTLENIDLNTTKSIIEDSLSSPDILKQSVELQTILDKIQLIKTAINKTDNPTRKKLLNDHLLKLQESQKKVEFSLIVSIKRSLSETVKEKGTMLIRGTEEFDTLELAILKKRALEAEEGPLAFYRELLNNKNSNMSLVNRTRINAEYVSLQH